MLPAVAFGAPAIASGIMSGGGILGALASGGSFLSGAGNFLSGLGIGGGGQSNARASRLAVEAEERAIYNQERLDKHRPSWIVEGAKAAGVNPLVALGMQPIGPSSGVVGDTGGRSDLGSRLADAGQGISRASEALMSGEERKFTRAVQMQQLQRGSLENELLASQIALSRAQLAPGFSSYRQGGVTPESNMVVDTRFGPVNIDRMHQAKPRFIIGHDAKGGTIRLTNPDLGDNEFQMGWDWATATLPDELRNLWRRSTQHLRSKTAHRFR